MEHNSTGRKWCVFGGLGQGSVRRLGKWTVSPEKEKQRVKNKDVVGKGGENWLEVQLKYFWSSYEVKTKIIS